MNIAQLTFIGGGNMALALAAGIRRRQPDTRIHVVEPWSEQHARWSSLADSIRIAADRSLVAGSDMIVLAVKPQVMAEACAALVPHLEGELILSVAAGSTIRRLSAWLGGHMRIIRSMPNTPALIGEGMSGLYAPPTVSAGDTALAATLLAACGDVLQVAEESALDAVTAVSGSGPAYVFHWIESLTSAAEAVGFSPDEAKRLVMKTLRGALSLAEQSSEPPAVLRERVTSKGGTTEAALAVLAERGVSDAYIAAIEAARRRAETLGRAED
ncbi:MAG: pyrroline-5-carboxylate reductase [Casimicrobiaceae bacterium]